MAESGPSTWRGGDGGRGVTAEPRDSSLSEDGRGANTNVNRDWNGDEDEDEKGEGGAYGVDGCTGVTVHTVEPAGEGESTVTREGERLSRSRKDLVNGSSKYTLFIVCFCEAWTYHARSHHVPTNQRCLVQRPNGRKEDIMKDLLHDNNDSLQKKKQE